MEARPWLLTEGCFRRAALGGLWLSASSFANPWLLTVQSTGLLTVQSTGLLTVQSTGLLTEGQRSFDGSGLAANGGQGLAANGAQRVFIFLLRYAQGGNGTPGERRLCCPALFTVGNRVTLRKTAI